MKKDKMIKCPYCKEKIIMNSEECPNCGKSLKLNNIAVNIIAAIIFIGIAFGIVSSLINTSNYKLIEKAIGGTVEQSELINDTLVSVGLEEFESITSDEILDGEYAEDTKGYRIKTSFSDNVILYLDGFNKVISIRWADKDFYLNNKVLLNFKDYTLTFDEKSDYN